MHGDAFAQHCRATTRHAERESAAQARSAHEQTFRGQHLAYLLAQEEQFRQNHAEFYATFEARQQELGAQFKLSDKTQALLRSEAGRLSAFIEHVREHGIRLHDFWEWDRACNPRGWHTKGVGCAEKSISSTHTSSISTPLVLEEKGSIEEGGQS